MDEQQELPDLLKDVSTFAEAMAKIDYFKVDSLAGVLVRTVLRHDDYYVGAADFGEGKRKGCGVDETTFIAKYGSDVGIRPINKETYERGTTDW